MRIAFFCLSASCVFVSLCRAQAPVFEITPVHSSIKFDVKASIDIVGKFDQWEATLTFTSPDETTGVLAIKIQSASVDTGSGMKNGKFEELARLLRRGAESIDHIQVDEVRADRS